MAQKKIQIQIANTVDINISGKKEQKPELAAVAVKVRRKASELGGRILLDKEFEDGFSMIISFTDEMNERLFRLEFGL